MQRHIEIFQIDAFTSEPFKGNPAAVVLEDSLSENEMKSIASEMNLSETSFLSRSNFADFNLKWFTPTTEVNLCVHATIAALHFLYEKNIIGKNSQISFKTKSGIIKVGKTDLHYWMQLPLVEFENIKTEPAELFIALGLSQNKINSQTVIGSNGCIFICVDNLSTLFNLKPDFSKISEIISSKNYFTEIVVYTLQTMESNSIAHLRFFSPNEGIPEDPVTGSAAGSLFLLLKNKKLIDPFTDDKIYVIEQGDVLNRAGRVGVSFNSSDKSLKIFGDAVTVMKGNLII
jgi:PhzF family phenazine biosynthesis protein